MYCTLTCLPVSWRCLGAFPAVAATPTRVDGDLFTVVMPNNPETASNVVAIPSGDVVIRTWNAVDEGDIYAITTADYPAKYVASHASEDFLVDARDNLITQLKGLLASQRTVELQGNSGTEFAITSDNGNARARAMMVGRRVYTMLVLDRSPGGEGAADKFLTSLRLKLANARSD